MPDLEKTAKEITIKKDIITSTDDSRRCYMGPKIPTGKVSCISIKCVKSVDDKQGGISLLIGVSKESHTNDQFLGYLKQDWSLSLQNG